MAFRFRACSGRISSIPILHCTKSRDRVRLQSSDQRWFGPETKAPLRRQADRRVEWSNARHDADRPDAGNGIEQEFGAAHSSSQRSSDTIGNTPPPSCQSLLMTPAGPPPPAGVIVFAKHLANHAPQSKIARRHQLRADACAAFSDGRPNACGSRMGAIPIARFCPSSGQAISFSSVGRRSPPPNVPDKDWQPLLLPSCQSISATPAGSPPPAGVAFCTATNQSRMACLPLWRRARILARISPKFPLDMHKAHGCHTTIALSFFAAQRIFQSIRSGRRQRRAAAQYASPRKG